MRSFGLRHLHVRRARRLLHIIRRQADIFRIVLRRLVQIDDFLSPRSGRGLGGFAAAADLQKAAAGSDAYGDYEDDADDDAGYAAGCEAGIAGTVGVTGRGRLGAVVVVGLRVVVGSAIDESCGEG